MSDEERIIGPALPPHLIKKTEENSGSNEERGMIGPALPPHLMKKSEESSSNEENFTPEENAIIGPALPPHLMKKSEEESSSTEGNSVLEENSIIGPALPPHMMKKMHQKDDNFEKKMDVVGPQLPPHLKKKVEESSVEPELPPHFNQEESSTNAEEEEEDEEVYGPLPLGETSYSKSQIALEERALQLKMDQLDPQESKATVREEWMLELPQVKVASLGLGPRQFRSKAGPDFSDRSSWTDTPNKKAKKEPEVDLKKEAEMKEIRKRDEEQEKISKKHKKKNKESLLEMHQNEIKKKKKDEGTEGERRPFSREIDLQVNRFDEAQKKAILKKAQLLDDRFSSGQSKFL